MRCGGRGVGGMALSPLPHPAQAMSKFTPDLIVFDLDGTLAATVPDIAAAVNRVLSVLGLPQHPEAAIQEMMGGGEGRLMQRALGPEHQDLFAQAHELYLTFYSRHLVERTRLYPGVKETLTRLAPRKLAVLSNKRAAFAQRILELLGLAPLFAAIKGGDSYGVLKPDPTGLVQLMGELATAPPHALMVGDKPADVLAGKAAGTATAAVTYGYGRLEQLAAAAPDAMLRQFPDLLALVE